MSRRSRGSHSSGIRASCRATLETPSSTHRISSGCDRCSSSNSRHRVLPRGIRTVAAGHFTAAAASTRGWNHDPWTRFPLRRRLPCLRCSHARSRISAHVAQPRVGVDARRNTAGAMLLHERVHGAPRRLRNDRSIPWSRGRRLRATLRTISRRSASHFATLVDNHAGH